MTRASDKARARRYARERDAVLRKLDVDALNAFAVRWNVRRPDKWIGEAPLIMMHKMRLVLATFTEAEKAVSRDWLISRGYDAAPDAGEIGDATMITHAHKIACLEREIAMRKRVLSTMGRATQDDGGQSRS